MVPCRRHPYLEATQSNHPILLGRPVVAPNSPPSPPLVRSSLASSPKISDTKAPAPTDLDEIPVCVGYEIDGEVTTDFPVTAKLEKAKPVLKTLPGWKCDIRGIRSYEKLPENCRKYVEFVEEQIGYPITMVSNGPGREDIIYRESLLRN